VVTQAVGGKTLNVHISAEFFFMQSQSSQPQALPIRKAVFPVAGLGTRFLPATKASPKEMLAVVDKPLIQYAVEEAYAAGIRHMIFVTGRNKRAIEDHFDTAYELEAELESAGKTELLKLVNSIQPPDMICSYVRQARSLGLGHAVLCAEPLVGHEPFAVLLADDLMQGADSASTQPGVGVMAQMVAAYAQLRNSIIAVQEVPLEHTRRYGIVAGDATEVGGGADAVGGLFNEAFIRIRQMVEKPAPEVAPSRLGVAGRYVLSPAVFAHIRRQPCGAGGEIQLTDGIASLLRDEAVYAMKYAGKRFDCGSKQGFLEATVELALQHPEVGAAFKAYLAGLTLKP
jgi:UTP--glucose-1-phosphate uridylyltransferase